MLHHYSHRTESISNDRTTVAEIIISQVSSGQTHAEETWAIAVGWLSVSCNEGVESYTEENLGKDIDTCLLLW